METPADLLEGIDNGKQLVYLSLVGLTVGPDGVPMTVTRAAKLAGVSDSTVRDWRQRQPGFREREKQIRTMTPQLLAQQVQQGIAAALPQAIANLKVLMGPGAPPQQRARLTEKVLEWAGASSEMTVNVSDDRTARLLEALLASEATPGDDHPEAAE